MPMWIAWVAAWGTAVALRAALLERILSVLEDEACVDRLVRHYEMYRRAIDSGACERPKHGMSWSDEKQKQRRQERKKARGKKGAVGQAELI